MNGISAVLADFIHGTKYDALEAEVIMQAKRRVLDTLGVALAGYKLMPFPRQLIAYFANLGGLPEATMLQTGRRFPAINAVFANAACAHSLDMDDGHRYGALHPGTVVVPSSLAAAELAGASTRELLTGVVIGYEVMVRIAMSVNPSSLNRGFHSTGIAGSFGSAAAAARIMDLSREEIIGALGLAGLQSSGLLQVNHDNEGAMVKPINPARAAMSGLFSTILAKGGAKGPLAIFEGEDGFLKAMADEAKPELLTRGLGEKFEIKGVYDKIYASCRHTHAAIDAALGACERGNIDPAEIKAIRIETYPTAIRLAGIIRPTTPSAARFSIPYSVALALVKRDASADKFCEITIKDEAIQGLADKVQLIPSQKWASLYPDKRGASVVIIGSNGHEWFAEVALAKGEPENPASPAEICRKFITNSTLAMPESDAKLLEELILNLENERLDRLVSLI